MLQCNIFMAMQHKGLTITECYAKSDGCFLQSRGRYLSSWPALIMFFFCSRGPGRQRDSSKYAGLLEQFSSAHVAFEQAMRFSARISHSAAWRSASISCPKPGPYDRGAPGSVCPAREFCRVGKCLRREVCRRAFAALQAATWLAKARRRAAATLRFSRESYCLR
jgi:hypothetical protein